MQPDLRSHLALLERHGKLLRVPRPVDPGTELAALIIEAERRRQAVLFESVRGSEMPCVANVVGDRAMVVSKPRRAAEAAVAAFSSETGVATAARHRTRRPGARRRPPATRVDLRRLRSLSTPSATRPLLHRRPRDRARSGDGQRNVPTTDVLATGESASGDALALARSAARRRPRPKPRSRSRRQPPTDSWRAPPSPGRRRADRRRAPGATELARCVSIDLEVPARRRSCWKEVRASLSPGLRRLHAVLRPGHAEPSCFLTPSRIDGTRSTRRCTRNGRRTTLLALSRSAARGRRRVRRRRSPGELAPDDPRRRHQHPKAVRGRAKEAGPPRPSKLSLAQALWSTGRRRPGRERRVVGHLHQPARRACSTSRTRRDSRAIRTASTPRARNRRDVRSALERNTSASAPGPGTAPAGRLSRALTGQYDGAAPDARPP
jgi:hypothetical protein